jgi:elongation of very long chain fatty acids protein 6
VIFALLAVLLYCWHAYHNRIGPGLYFASANYLVHSVMYTYYFLNAAKLHWLARPCAPFITTMQIVQMMVRNPPALFSLLVSSSPLSALRAARMASKTDVIRFSAP